MGVLGLMHKVCVGVDLTSFPGQPKFVRVGIRCSTEVGVSSSRREFLEKVDKELTNGDDRAALALVKDLQGKPDGLRCFGAARQVSIELSDNVGRNRDRYIVLTCFIRCVV